MPEVRIPYQHTISEWTVGDLAKALGVPDDVELAVPRTTPIRVSTLRAPSTNKPDGGDMEEGEYAVTDAGLEPDWIPPDHANGEHEGHWQEPGSTFYIGTDFPSGEYERYEEQP